MFQSISEIINQAVLVQPVQIPGQFSRLPRVEQPYPHYFSIELFPHQLVSVYNMEQLEKNKSFRTDSNELIMTRAGIFADRVGSGKSLSLVYLILRDKLQSSSNMDVDELSHTLHVLGGDNLFMQSYSIISFNRSNRIPTTLIVASPNIIEQWMEYFHFIKAEHQLRILEVSKKSTDYSQIVVANWDVIIVSTARYQEFAEHFRNYVWKRIILDDLPSTPISRMNSLDADFIWIVSATYRELQYSGNTGFLNNISRDYQIIREAVIKNSPAFIDESFILPEVREVYHTCRNPKVLNVLRGHVPKEIYDMIAGGDYQGAIREMGGHSVNPNNLIDLVRKKHQDRLFEYQQKVEYWTRRMNEQSWNPLNRKEMEQWMQRVASQEKVLEQLEQKYNEMIGDVCPICMDQSDRKSLVPCCQNMLCCECIVNWLQTKKNCPMCRQDLNLGQLIVLSSENKDDEKKEEEKKEETNSFTKEEKILKILEEGTREGKRFIIFSFYGFYTIRAFLHEKKLPFHELMGQKSTRERKLKEFKSGKTPILFLNSEYSGAGINLTETDEIIFYSNMQNQEEIKQQNIGRAMRIGRTKPLIVHNFNY